MMLKLQAMFTYVETKQPNKRTI